MAKKKSPKKRKITGASEPKKRVPAKRKVSGTTRKSGKRKAPPPQKKVKKETHVAVPEKKSVPWIPAVFIMLVIIAGIVWLIISQKAEITFVFNSNFKKQEPVTAAILINDRLVSTTDSNGNAQFHYKARIGETLNITFEKFIEKEDWISLSDFELIVTAKDEIITKTLDFEKQSYVTFVFHSELAANEPVATAIIINGKKIEETDSSGKVKFRYKAQLSDVISVKFEKARNKENWTSLSDFDLELTKKDTTIVKSIRFKEQEVLYSVTLDFQNKESVSVFIILNGDSIGALNSIGHFSYNKQFRKEDKMRLEFEVESSQFDIETVPNVITYNVNRSISDTINIYALLRKIPVISLRFINETTKELLRNIDVKFSDSEEIVRTNKFGLINYRIQSRRIGETITYSLPQKFVSIKSSYEKIKLIPDMPDTLSYVLHCEAKYGVQLVVIDMDGDPISGVIVTLENQQESTNNKGEVDFEIPRIDKLYNVKIQKDRYQDISTEIAPRGFVTADTFRLEAVYGKLVVVDSLTGDPVPYIDIFERSKNIGQTGKDGKATINILLNQPLKLSLRPPPNSIYLTKKTNVTFARTLQSQEVRISRKPYVFNFVVRNDKDNALKGVRIEHRGRTYTTDKKGQAFIKMFVVEPSPQEEFEITHGRYQDKRFVLTNKATFEYEIAPVIISGVARVVIKTSPEGGNIRVINELGKEEISGQSPLIVDLEYDTYRFVASDKSGTPVEITHEVVSDRGEEDPIVIDLTNPVAQILSFYSQGEHIRVTQTYMIKRKQVSYILDNNKPYNTNRCEILKKIATSFGAEKRYNEAVEILEIVDNDCKPTDPYFYKNFAATLFNLERWEKSSEKYKKAVMFLSYVPKAKRAEFHADCLYNEGQAMLNFFSSQDIGREFPEEDVCDYLENMGRVFDDFIYVTQNNRLNSKEVGIKHAKGKIHEWRTDNECK